MKEYVGTCGQCGKAVYCCDGFLNGVVVDGKVFCFLCVEKEPT
ncbi:hypothetical protein [Metabacillus iocasae]|uniref:Uncharacterized protein n=1 Tax=Priestia iocasae TaxID=2291674 RepID=A0ABS2QYT8_9BACI|nr:hypothetical protein [Metabacillus iocasae]